MPADTRCLRLDDWGVIRARGADARAFLQGQLTNDVVSLAPGQARLAGFCSARGRLLASFVVWPDGDDLLLACSADVLPAALKRLSMFVLRAKCQLSDVSAERPLWGSVGGAAGRAWSVAEGAIVLPDALDGEERVARRLTWAPPDDAPLPTAQWRGLEAASGVPRVVAATVEQFVPQMVNLELVDGVSFSKGCYPGQEVVARSQYRGTLKRRGFLLAGDALLAPGQEVFDSADPDQPAGSVVLAGTLGGRPLAFASLKIAAADSGRLQAGGAALSLLPLPYALPAETA